MKTDQDNNSRLDEPRAKKAELSSLAMLAFILSIVSIASVFMPTVVPCFLVPFLAIPSIVLGGIALITIKRSRGGRRGNWMAGIAITISFVWVTFFFVLVPVLVGIKRYAFEVKQRVQLLSIATAIELFKSEFGRYPPSDALDGDGTPYCGAMKLCEAVVGQDLLGVHPDTVFRSDGTDGKGTMLYFDANDLSVPVYRYDDIMRKGPYLPIENVNAYRLRDLYQDVGPFDGNTFVICDMYKTIVNISAGKTIHMPVLYYKADTAKSAHDVNDPNNPENIYDYRDNQALLALGVPGKPGQKHPLFENPKIFYEMTRDYRATKVNRPVRADTYILLSAGWDGLYGTQDDIPNFEMRWKPK